MHPATLYLFAGAPTDEVLGQWLGPRTNALRLLPAQVHPTERLVTLRYDGVGAPKEGLAALVAALGHLAGPGALLAHLAPLAGRLEHARKLLGLRGTPPDPDAPLPPWVNTPLPTAMLVP